MKKMSKWNQYRVGDTCSAIYSGYVHALDVLGKTVKVVGYLQAEFSRGAEDDGLRVLTVGVGLLEQGQSVGSRLSCSSLSQGYHIVLITKQIGYYLFLDWHRMLKAQFFDGAANVLAHAQFFKCLQCSLPC